MVGAPTGGQADGLAMLCWLLKDLGWAGACWPLAVPSGGFSILMQSFGLYVAVAVEGITCEEYAYRVAMLGWIVGNFTWMMSDFLFDGLREPSQRLPWNVGPILHPNNDGYERGLLATRVTLFCTLAFLSLFYMRSASIHMTVNGRRPVVSRDELNGRTQTLIGRGGGSGVHTALKQEGATRSALTATLQKYMFPQELYHVVFVTAWILKDLCWTYEMLSGALTAALVLVGLMILQLATRGLVCPIMQLAEFIWVLGNTTWVLTELYDDDAHRESRCTACFLLLCGVLMACVNLWGDRFLPEKITLALQGSEEEKKPLLQTLI